MADADPARNEDHLWIGRTDPDPVQEDEEDSQCVAPSYWAVRRSMVTFTERWPMSARSRRASRTRGSIFL